MARRARSYFEIVVVSVLVAITVVLGAGIYADRTKSLKAELLINELSMMRSSLLAYKLLNRRNAENLVQLTTATHYVDGKRRPYIEELPPSDEGKIIDPFGNPYSYDPKTGWVSSSTSGYVQW